MKTLREIVPLQEASDGHTKDEISALHQSLKSHLGDNASVGKIVHHKDNRSSFQISKILADKKDMASVHTSTAKFLQSKNAAHKLSAISDASETYRPQSTFRVNLKRKV